MFKPNLSHNNAKMKTELVNNTVCALANVK